LFLSLLLILSLIFVGTNEYHHLIWSGFSASPAGNNLLVYHHGVGFYFIATYEYFFILLGIVSLIFTYRESKRTYRLQMGLILLSLFVPIAASLVYEFGFYLPGLDLTPISFSISALLLSINISRYHLFDLVPIARHWIIEEMGDGITVLDLQDRVIDVNPAAERIIGSNAREIIGKPAKQLLGKWPFLLEHTHDLERTQAEIFLPEPVSRYFDVHTTPVLDRNKNLAGRLIAFRDVTQHKITEATLARYAEEMGIINRINLAITSGLNLDRVLKTLHEQCGQVVPIDIFYVALYNRASSLVNIPIYYDNGQYHIGPSRDINDNPGIIGSVIQSRQTLYLHDALHVGTRPLFRTEEEEMQAINSYVGIPLTVRDEVIGVMSIQSKTNNAFTDDHILLLDRIAVQAAIAIENARQYAEEQRLAIIGELTGIYNYRGLQELGAREVEHARRFDHPLSALFFDVDDFRNFNNVYSHAIGNIVLQDMVKRCQTFLRSVDIFSRFGGDEFVALLPETDFANAKSIGQRLADAVANTIIPTSCGDLAITITIGAAELTDRMADWLL
jgi:diguanylate cyclase (GGDEF)-like protein/PAS domain S-box-containing protein